MIEKMKLLLDIFGKITAGVLMATAAYITIFLGTESENQCDDFMAGADRFRSVLCSDTFFCGR